MSTGSKMQLATAQRVANAIVQELQPGCARIEIAGSIRRQKLLVGDIEIVAIPAFIPDLFGGQGQNKLDAILDQLVQEKRLEKIKGGDLYKQFKVVKAGCNLDLFLTEEEKWCLIFTIRTGPAEFSARLVTQKHKGGMLPDYLHVTEGILWDDDGKHIPTLEEGDVFKVLGIDFIQPEDRK